MENVTYLAEKKERFEKMYFQTRALLFHYISKFVTTGQEGVEDVIQECYIRLWENMHKITDDENVIPLLRTYAINYSINQLQKYAKEQIRARIYYDQRELTTDIRDDLHYKHVLSAFNQAVESLPPQRKLVYRLVREKGLSHQEISAQLGISPKTVERHINEALRTLRTQFTVDKIMFTLILLRIEKMI
jgi:RNA polymerase sigma-70 factor (ECF subfamily)